MKLKKTEREEKETFNKVTGRQNKECEKDIE